MNLWFFIGLPAGVYSPDYRSASFPACLRPPGERMTNRRCGHFRLLSIVSVRFAAFRRPDAGGPLASKRRTDAAAADDVSIVSGAARGRRSIAYSAAARRALGAAFAGKWGLATLRHKSSRRKSSLSRRAGGRLSRVRRVAHRWLREFSAATTTRTRADAFAAYRRTDI